VAGLTSFIGRDEEIALLMQRWQRAMNRICHGRMASTGGLSVATSGDLETGSH
jgi:hypothetical protein